MDVSEIKKVASRRKMTVEVEKLRERVSKENKKIIKLKVAQDTAYWDLKEKLRQVEANHEKLQQNMLEVQMQYETVSGQYQEELRQRAETLNKLASTREVCNVLEDYCERLRDTLSRCKADQATLYEAYQKFGQLFKDLKAQQIQQDEKSRDTIEGLQDKLKQTTDYHNQLQNIFTEEKQRMISELQEEKKKITSVLSKNNELLAANTELGALVDHSRRELEKKEEIIARHEADIKKLIQEFNSMTIEMKNNSFKLENELKETTAEKESLKQALQNQENFTKNICDQNNQLQEKVAMLEKEKDNAENVHRDMELHLKQMEAREQNLELQIKSMEAKNSRLEKEISNKDETIANFEIELQKVTDQLAAMDLEKCEVHVALDRAKAEAETMVTKVQELTEAGMTMEIKIQEIENSFKASRDAAEAKIKEMTLVIEGKDKDLESKASSISSLIDQIKNISDSHANLETTIQNLRQELATEKDAAGEREKRMEMKIEQLNVAVRNKDNELSKKLTVILELRADKEVLNEKIQTMQDMLDNVQKELTRPTHTKTSQNRIEPEQDDNAVMFAPVARNNNIQAPPAKKPEFEVPAPPQQPNFDTFSFNFLSDSSMEGDNTIDASLVNRRFEAMSRGEPLSPLPLSSLKRRRGTAAVPATQGGLRFKQPARNEDMSQPQVTQSAQNKPRSFFKTKRHEKTRINKK